MCVFEQRLKQNVHTLRYVGNVQDKKNSNEGKGEADGSMLAVTVLKVETDISIIVCKGSVNEPPHPQSLLVFSLTNVKLSMPG